MDDINKQLENYIDRLADDVLLSPGISSWEEEKKAEYPAGERNASESWSGEAFVSCRQKISGFTSRRKDSQ